MMYGMKETNRKMQLNLVQTSSALTQLKRKQCTCLLVKTEVGKKKMNCCYIQFDSINMNLDCMLNSWPIEKYL